MNESSLPVLAKSEHDRFRVLDARITKNLALIARAAQAYRQLVEDLTEVHDKKLYFAKGYPTFEDYCTRKLGKTRQHIYGLMRSHDTLKRLLAQGIPEEDLPATERLNRAIRDAINDLPPEKQDEALVPIWKATMRVAREKGRRPTVIDVQEAAVEIINSDKTIERQQRELLSRFEGAGRALKVGLAFDTLTPDFRRRLQVVLMAIADQLKVLLAALNTQAVADRADSSSAEQKARIIKEEIAKAHGEGPSPKASSAHPAKEAISILHPNGQRYQLGKPFKFWIADDSARSGARCTKCNKEVSAGYTGSLGDLMKLVPNASCDCSNTTKLKTVS
jgi:hypothetical protein